MLLEEGMQKKSNVAALVLIFISITAAIVLKSWFDPNGYLSPDSTNYLALAQNLVDGNGFHTIKLNGEPGWFAVWPVGYPTMIAGVAKLTGLSVFWSSKILNILFILAILYVFYRTFDHSAYLYGLLLTFGAYLEIYSYTWSEVPFIFALVLFAISLSKFWDSGKDDWHAPLFWLWLSSLLLFLSRYVGAFSVGAVFLLLIAVAMRQNLKKAALLAFPLVLNTIFIISYLSNNKTLTGFSTGTERRAAPETHFELARSLVGNIFREFIFPMATWSPNLKMLTVFLAQFMILGVALYIARKHLRGYFQGRRIDSLVVSFFVIGMIYLASIVTIRWRSHFDGFSFRLLAPGSLLIFIAFIRHIWLSFDRKPPIAIIYGLAALSLLSLFVSALYPVIRHVVAERPTYGYTIKHAEQNCQALDLGSVILSIDGHTIYLCPKVATIQFNPNQELDEVTARMAPSRPVFLRIPSPPAGPPTSFDNAWSESLLQLTQTNTAGSLVRIQ
jgi:hypothetical protein